MKAKYIIQELKMKVTQFDKNNLTAIRNELDAAVAVVAEKFGIQIHCGSASYNSNETNMKLKMNVLGDGGEKKINPTAVYHAKVDFGPDFDITKSYKDRQLGEVRFVEYRTRARTQPWVIQAPNGKQYLLSVSLAQMIAKNPV